MQLEKPIYRSDLDIKYSTTNTTLSEAIHKTFGITLQTIEDGVIHRFSTKGDRNLDGWYVATNLNSNLSFATYGTWRDSDNKYTWCSREQVTPEEKQFIRIKQEEHAELRKEASLKASQEAKEIYERSEIATNHPYLMTKGIENVDGIAKIDKTGKSLILPLYYYTEYGTKDILSIQFINEDGKKSFKKNASTSGGFLEIGKPKGTTFLCEGFATGASVHAATGAHVVVAFNAGNLLKVAPYFPHSIIIADNDQSGTGESYAQKTGLPYILIPSIGMDANDYVNNYGIGSLATLLNPYIAEIPRSYITCMKDDEENQREVEWLIENWIEMGGFCMMHGQPGSGKSFIAMDMLLSVSSGKGNWKGYDSKSGPILYLCGEGFSGIPSRIKAWRQENDNQDIGKAYRTQYAVPLNEKDGQFVIEQISSMEEKPILICIDTLNRFFSGDENSAEEMGRLISFIGQLQQKFGSAILLVHHTGASKDSQDRARGSSALRGAVDTEISLSILENKTIQVTQKKQKNTEYLDPIFMELKTIEIDGWKDKKNRPIKSAFPVLKKDADNIQIDTLFKEKNYFVLAYAYSKKILTKESNIFLSKSDFRKYLMEVEKWTENEVKNAIYRNEKSRMIPKLISAGLIQESEYECQKGWIVINSTLSQMCIISSQVKGGKNK